MKLLNWICKNTGETCLIGIFIASLLSFIMDDGSFGFFGFWFGCSAPLNDYFLFKKEKSSKLFSLLQAALLLIGLTSFFFIVNRASGQQWQAWENCLVTYTGAFAGILVAQFIVDFVKRERKEQKANDEWMDQQIKIALKEKEGYTSIKKNGKHIGFIESKKYNEFIKNNIEQ